MERKNHHPWSTYLQSVTKLSAWETSLFDQIKYDGTILAEEACHVALDVINLTRQLGIDTSRFEASKDAMTYCAQLIGEYCGSGHAACELLDQIGTEMKGNEAAQAKLRALHGMLRICRMPGVTPFDRVPSNTVMA